MPPDPVQGEAGGAAWAIGSGTAVAVAGGGAARSTAAAEGLAEVAEILAEEGRVEIGERLGLTAEERERIRLAVHAAEQRTNAEIVQLIVAGSGLNRDSRNGAALALGRTG